jgi:cytidyltransferase-like protein
MGGNSSNPDHLPPLGKHSTGVILGRFLPPHRGHEYLAHFAASFVDKLWIFVCSLPHDPIPGTLRATWMQDLFPAATIIHIEEVNPAANRSQPGAQAIWARAVREHLDAQPDFIFASEDYGWEFAAALGACFVPVDPSRDQFPISGTELRSKPFRHWHYLPAVVRPFFVREIMIDAPECQPEAAEEIIQRTAMLLNTLYVPVYSRFYQGFTQSARHPMSADAQGRAQAALTAALKGQARCFLLRSTMEGLEGSLPQAPDLVFRLDFGHAATAGTAPMDWTGKAGIETITLACSQHTAAHAIRDAAYDRFKDWF